MSKRKDFKPVFVGHASFANGTRFRLDQVNERGAIRITDQNGNQNYARTYANAWASVRYQARINPITERTLDE